MTFLRADQLRATSTGALVGGHLLEVQPTDPPGRQLQRLVRWQLRRGGCLALLDVGDLDLAGPLLAGGSSLPAAGGCDAVSWAYGAWPSSAAARCDPGSDRAGRSATRGGVIDRVDVVFGRGLRRAVLAPAHRLPGGMWIAAGPGR